MIRRVGAGLLWLVASTLLLAGGFALLLLAARRGIEGDAEAAERTRTALVVYARVVLVKGLLPQLWLSLLLWPLLDRLGGLRARGRAGVALGVSGAALVAVLLVSSTLLRLDLPELPAVVFRGPGNFVATVLEMAGAVAAAGLLPRLVFYSRFGSP